MKGRARRPCRRDGRKREVAFLIRAKGEVVPWAPRSSPFPFKNQAEVPCLQTRAGSHLTHCNGFQTKQQQETSTKFQKGNCCYQRIHTCLPPLHTPFLLGRKAEGFAARQPLVNPLHSPRSTRGSRAEHSPSVTCETSSWQEELLRSRLPCKAECSGSVVADEDVQEWMGCGTGEVMRRG